MEEGLMVGIATDLKGCFVKVENPDNIPKNVMYIKSFIKESNDKEFYLAVCNNKEFIIYYDQLSKSMGSVLDNGFAELMGLSNLDDYLKSDNFLDLIPETGCIPFFDDEEECWMMQFDITRRMNINEGE